MNRVCAGSGRTNLPTRLRDVPNMVRAWSMNPRNDGPIICTAFIILFIYLFIINYFSTFSYRHKYTRVCVVPNCRIRQFHMVVMLRM
jgi:hypothetical protein